MITGSLQIKNGKYYAVINLKDANGKRKLKWISTGLDEKNNKRKAEKFLSDKIKELEANEGLIASDILFCDYVKHWLKNAEIKVDLITFQGYEYIAKSHIIPYFKTKNIKLSEIKREDIQQYINEKYENGRLDGKGGLAPKSIKTHMIIIKQTLKEAMKENYIMSNPADLVNLPKLQKHEPNFYTVKQLNQMFELIKDEPLFPLIYFTALFGLRRSEVLGLKWDSINEDMTMLTIKSTVVRFTEVIEKDSTRTSSSYRSFPIPYKIKDMLIEIKKNENICREMFGNEYIENKYIFKWDNGKPFAPDYITQKFSKLLKAYNLPHIRFHDLRHSCASLLVANGFTLKDIQEWLGHSDIQITANIYAHLDTARKNSIADSLSGCLNIWKALEKPLEKI